MFFLVPYNLIDRNDLSIVQKMCILYLARHFDEKGSSVPINELEIAEKLRLSTSEVRLNLDVLLSKGIINIDNTILNYQNEDKDAKDIIVKEAVFKDLPSDSFEELKLKLNNKIKPDESLTDGLEEEKTEVLEEEKDLAYDEFMAKITSAEEKIKERASKLKLNVRRENRREKYNKNNADRNSSGQKYNRRKTDRINQENVEKPSETDELLQILSESNKSILEEKKTIIDDNYEKFKNRPNRRREDVQEKRKSVNPKFMKASSVYKQQGIKKTRKTDENKDDIEV